MILFRTQVNIWMLVTFVNLVKCMYLSILNANIIGMVTNLDKLKLFIDDLDYTFEITEIWTKTHNVDGNFINGY